MTVHQGDASCPRLHAGSQDPRSSLGPASDPGLRCGGDVGDRLRSARALRRGIFRRPVKVEPAACALGAMPRSAGEVRASRQSIDARRLRRLGIVSVGTGFSGIAPERVT